MKLKSVLFISILIITMLSMNSIATKSGKFITEPVIKDISKTMTDKFGADQQIRIEKGIKQVADLWVKEDGSVEDFKNFCVGNFIAEPDKLDKLFDRLNRNFEILIGGLVDINRDLRRPLVLNWGEPLNIDYTFASYSPFAHINSDFFNNKLAFIIRLNFPYYTLEQKTELGKNWDTKQWSYARMGDRFSTRIPAEVNQEVNTILSDADHYISTYNIYMGNLVDENMKKYWPADLFLITHWGIRDDLKARYSDKDGLKQQEIIFAVMEDIITQDIPKDVINSNKYLWDPVANKLYNLDGKEIPFEREPDTRYQVLLDTFKTALLLDPYNPELPNHIKRKFEEDREIPEKDVEKLFVDFISSDEIRKIGKLIEKKLGRELRPFDLWYTGFRPSGSITEEELDKIVSAKYPNAEAFQKDMPNILQNLGFSKEQAEFLESKIQIEGSRGIGHASGAERRDMYSNLRTRIPEAGLNYKGWNIAIHEFGHCAEQTLTLHKVPNYAMHGIPNTALTEAFAFVFQARDIELLGIKQDTSMQEHMKALHSAWSTYEIMGVSLVDMQVWHWMYEHPEATAAELKEAVIRIAKDVWNKYYADVFGTKDEIILAIYSHMIDSTLYLPDYPIGHVAEFQMHKYMEGKNLGEEMVRMCSAGRLVPQLWMQNAVGSPLSTEPMLKAVNEALKIIK
ncbi:MAG: hypothetical protein JW737_10175 [Acidobacteria bacterium]|nr:hypothetical protein [Acidobacteriota bacterium]